MVRRTFLARLVRGFAAGPLSDAGAPADGPGAGALARVRLPTQAFFPMGPNHSMHASCPRQARLPMSPSLRLQALKPIHAASPTGPTFAMQACSAMHESLPMAPVLESAHALAPTQAFSPDGARA